jgi:hypothetical protein
VERTTRPGSRPAAGAPEARERAASRALACVALLAFVLLRVPFVALPLERDEGDYAYVAWRMLEGEVPYRDAFDQKPPGIYAVYAALFALGPRSPVALHLWLYAWSAASALGLAALVRGLAGGLAAACALLLFAALSTDPRLTATAANTESFLLLPLVLSWGALWRAERGGGARAWAAAGALAAAACWIKPVAATHGLFAAAWAVAGAARARPQARTREAARRLAALALGAAAVSAAALGALAWLGALRDFVDIVVVHNWSYTRQHGLAEGLALLGHALAWLAPSHASAWAAAAAGLVARATAPARVRAFFAGQLAAAALGACAGLHFREHYFVQLLPALCALGGIGLAAVARRALAARSGVAAAAGVAAVAALALVPFLAADAHFLFAGSPRELSRRIYALNPFPESPAIAEHIAGRSGPLDTVYVVGSEPQIPFLAQRRSATRYILFYPLTGPYADALARQREAMREVAERRPLYVVWTDVAGSLLVDERSERWIFERSRELIAREYLLELAVHPTPEGDDYVVSRGPDAQRWANVGKRARPDAPWVGVYRRASEPPAEASRRIR